MLKIRGVNVFPSQIESVLMKYENIAPHYQLVVTRENYSDALEVKVELVDGTIRKLCRVRKPKKYDTMI